MITVRHLALGQKLCRHLSFGACLTLVACAAAPLRDSARVASPAAAVNVAQPAATPLVAGNDAHLLIDGPQTEAAMLQAIAKARHQIDLESYIVEPIDIGERLASLLEARRAAGVAVRVLYDSIGSLATPAAYFERLRAAGIATCEFNPINPLQLRDNPRLSINNRDHRKVLIIDGQVAFTGGVNISGVYSASSFGHRHEKEARESGWRDTHVLVRGPVVEQFQRLFEDTWHSQDCSLNGQVVPPHRPAAVAGDMTMRLVAADPARERSELYVALLSAIEGAERRIWLTYGYFVPDERLVQALQAAARRGVDVRLALPGFSDFWAPFHAGRSRYAALLKAGVHIFERRDALLHAKTAVIDGVWSSVGSTNLDWRSFVHDYEADVLVLDRRFAGEMEQLFRRDEAASQEVGIREWRRRSIADHFLEWLARGWEYLL
ncbi:MAG: phospholipase D-like domain-containing protein [Bacteroidota bacterium]